jgi:hypothetical protein
MLLFNENVYSINIIRYLKYINKYVIFHGKPDFVAGERQGQVFCVLGDL